MLIAIALASFAIASIASSVGCGRTSVARAPRAWIRPSPPDGRIHANHSGAGSRTRAAATTAVPRRRRSRGASRVIGARSKGRGRRSRNSRPLQSAPPRRLAEERIDPFGRRPQDGPHHPGETRQSLARPGVSAQPGCMALIATPLVFGGSEAASPLAHEGDRARFARVGSRPRVRPDARLQIVEIEALGIHAAGRHGDDSTPWSVAGGGAVPTPARMGRRPSWRTSLDPVAGLATVRKDRAGVVDKDVEATLRRCDTIDRVGDRGERRHIRDHDGESVDASAAMSVERSP